MVTKLFSRKINSLRSVLLNRRRVREIIAQKATFDPALLGLMERHRKSEQPPVRAWIDATYDNPHFWFDLALFSAAVNVDLAQSTAYLGRYAHRQISATLANLGIGEVKSHLDQVKYLESVTPLVNELLEATHSADDILLWKLPEDYPPEVVYDTLLKWQRQGVVDIHHKDFRQHVRQCVEAILATRKALEGANCELMLCSHNIGEIAAPLCWNAMRMGVPTYVLYSDFGGSRFIRVNSLSTFLDIVPAPTLEQLESLSAVQKERLQQVGADYLQERLGGKTGDIGSRFAHTKKADEDEFQNLLHGCGWTADKPIVSMFMMNWFDFPHSVGVRRFRDFHDLLESLLRVAQERTDVNWLIRAHPLDVRYGISERASVRMMTDKLNCPHIRPCPVGISAATVIRYAAGIITPCGTVGMEATSLGTPVMVSERAWYGEHGFVLEPGSREGFLQKLKENWWEQLDMERAKTLAERFAGFYYGYPAWQKGFILKDSSLQGDLHDYLLHLIEGADAQIGREIEAIADWREDPSTRFMVYKNMRAEDYIHGSMSNSLVALQDA